MHTITRGTKVPSINHPEDATAGTQKCEAAKQIRWRRSRHCNVLRSDLKVTDMNTLFNLEGALGASKRIDGGLAQLGERLPCKQEVSGSIPLISTKRANSSAG